MKDNLYEELKRTKAELHMLFEISNAMRTTLRLDEILFIILTGVTSHVGLGFNRALLFLINEKEQTIEGKMGIGPDTGEEADKIWKQIERQKMTLDDFIIAYKHSKETLDCKLNRIVKNMSFPLKNKDNFLSFLVNENKVLHLKHKDRLFQKFENEILFNIVNKEEFVAVPLRAKNKVLGVIIADNLYTRKPITDDEIRILTMFANQAGLAIENSYLYEQTVLQAHTDSLTHLWNHGFFQQMLSQLIEEAKRKNLPLSLAIIDIDDFKNYNDNLGHQKGDILLQQIADLLRNSSRKFDYVCRYGGEEFCIIFPQTPKKEALQIAERLRKSVQDYPFLHKEIQPSHAITISVGIASYPQDAASKEELLLHADKALYQAKHQGKNKVIGYIP
jgi:diguanylate cyclase (GGDEF)-like protein